MNEPRTVRSRVQFLAKTLKKKTKSSKTPGKISTWECGEPVLIHPCP
jgi:hypothetical protein